YDRCPNASLVAIVKDVDRRLDAIRRTVFVNIPYRGSGSVDEHRELIELLEQEASASEIESVARQHKLTTVESFRRWHREHAAES
ncbi:MAG: GntR family transcriptional regulator, partial [Steroidobacteraceae bacterium]